MRIDLAELLDHLAATEPRAVHGPTGLSQPAALPAAAAALLDRLPRFLADHYAALLGSLPGDVAALPAEAALLRAVHAIACHFALLQLAPELPEQALLVGTAAELQPVLSGQVAHREVLLAPASGPWPAETATAIDREGRLTLVAGHPAQPMRDQIAQFQLLASVLAPPGLSSGGKCLFFGAGPTDMLRLESAIGRHPDFTLRRFAIELEAAGACFVGLAERRWDSLPPGVRQQLAKAGEAHRQLLAAALDVPRHLPERRCVTWDASVTSHAAWTDPLRAEIGIGAEQAGFGFAAARLVGIDLLAIDLRLTGQPTRLGATSFLGLVVDFRRDDGSWHRLGLSLAAADPPDALWMLDWGKGAGPIDSWWCLPADETLTLPLPLRVLAPAGWDGTVWISFGMRDAGPHVRAAAQLSWCLG